jgi:hypothetical protein
MLRARDEMERLVSSANAAETEMACPARPSLTPRSAATGVSKLTGMNSEAISAKTHTDIAKTPDQCARPSAVADSGMAPSGFRSIEAAGARLLQEVAAVGVLGGQVLSLGGVRRGHARDPGSMRGAFAMP